MAEPTDQALDPSRPPESNGGEAPALEALKARIIDAPCPSLDLARALKTHMGGFPQSIRRLAEKLGVPEDFRYFSDALGLLELNLPPKDLERLEGKLLSRRAIGKIKDACKRGQGVDNPKKRIKRVDRPVDSVDKSVDSDQGVRNGVDSQKNENNSVDSRGQSVDSVDSHWQQAKTETNRVDSDVDNDQKVEADVDTLKSESKRVDKPNNRVDSVKPPVTPPRQGYPLIRDTIDELLKLLTFWRQELHLGQIVVRWLLFFRGIGWLRTSLRALLIGLAVYGTYQAAHQGWNWMRRLKAPHPYSLSPGERVGGSQAPGLAWGPGPWPRGLLRSRSAIPWSAISS